MPREAQVRDPLPPQAIAEIKTLIIESDLTDCVKKYLFYLIEKSRNLSTETTLFTRTDYDNRSTQILKINHFLRTLRNLLEIYHEGNRRICCCIKDHRLYISLKFSAAPICRDIENIEVNQIEIEAISLDLQANKLRRQEAKNQGFNWYCNNCKRMYRNEIPPNNCPCGRPDFISL